MNNKTWNIFNRFAVHIFNRKSWNKLFPPLLRPSTWMLKNSRLTTLKRFLLSTQICVCFVPVPWEKMFFFFLQKKRNFSLYFPIVLLSRPLKHSNDCFSFTLPHFTCFIAFASWNAYNNHFVLTGQCMFKGFSSLPLKNWTRRKEWRKVETC